MESEEEEKIIVRSVETNSSDGLRLNARTRSMLEKSLLDPSLLTNL